MLTGPEISLSPNNPQPKTLPKAGSTSSNRCQANSTNSGVIRRLNRLHGLIFALGLLLVPAAARAQSDATFQSTHVCPDLPVNVPSAASSSVDYTYFFFGYSVGSLQCGHIYVDVEGLTTEAAYTNSVQLRNRSVAEQGTIDIYPWCQPGVETVTYTSHCIQTNDASSPTCSPSTDTSACSYSNCSFFNAVFGYLANVQANPPACLTLTTDHSSGPGWTLDYTHPSGSSLCSYFSEVSCPRPDISETAQCIGQISGNSAYYSISLHLDQGATPPTLPALPSCPAGHTQICTNCDEN